MILYVIIELKKKELASNKLHRDRLRRLTSNLSKNRIALGQKLAVLFFYALYNHNNEIEQHNNETCKCNHQG